MAEERRACALEAALALAGTPLVIGLVWGGVGFAVFAAADRRWGGGVFWEHPEWAAAITDPHRAIDWLSTYPQVVLIALGERP